MAVTVLIFVLAAAFLHATWNIIVKGGSNKEFEIGLNALGGGIASLILLVFVPAPAGDAVYLLALSCFFHFLYNLSVASTYKVAELSVAYPVMRGAAPILTALTLAVFGAGLPLIGWLGVLLLSCGVFCLALQQKPSGQDRFKGVGRALRTSIFITGYTLADGFGARLAENSFCYTVWLFLLNIIPINFYIFYKYGKSYLDYFPKRGLTGIAGGLCGFASYGIAIWAMTVAPIALVAALRETSVIFGMILALLVLKEKITILRVIAVVLVMAGAIFAKLG